MVGRWETDITITRGQDGSRRGAPESRAGSSERHGRRTGDENRRVIRDRGTGHRSVDGVPEWAWSRQGKCDSRKHRRSRKVGKSWPGWQPRPVKATGMARGKRQAPACRGCVVQYWGACGGRWEGRAPLRRPLRRVESTEGSDTAGTGNSRSTGARGATPGRHGLANSERRLMGHVPLPPRPEKCLAFSFFLAFSQTT